MDACVCAHVCEHECVGEGCLSLCRGARVHVKRVDVRGMYECAEVSVNAQVCTCVCEHGCADVGCACVCAVSVRARRVCPPA